MKNIYVIIFAILLINVSATAQCEEDRHSTFKNQGWFSCNKSISQVPDRGASHWVLYDFTYPYVIEKLFIWNHNVWGETGKGAKEIIIDYSLDGQEWTAIGPFDIEKAPGSWKYKGSEGPNLGNVKGRFFLVTVLETHDGEDDCAGIGEIKWIIGEEVNTEDIAEDEYMISPNPSSEMVTLTIPNTTNVKSISINNRVGQKVQDISLPSSNKLVVPIAGLNPGMYFFNIVDDSGLVTSKSFVKI